MAQYDGSIRINTQIKIKEAQVQLSTLENKIVKTSDKITSLRSKMDALKDQKIPTESYKALDEYVIQLESSIENLTESLERLEGKGLKGGEAYKNISKTIEEMSGELKKSKEEMHRLVDLGKAFTLGSDSEEFAKLGQQLKYEENNLDVLTQKHDVLKLKIQQIAKDGYKRLGDAARKSFSSIGNILKKANSHVNSFGKRLKEIAHRILPTFHKETKRTNTVLGQFSTRLKSLLSGMFIFNVISSYIRKMFSGVNEGFANFYNHNVAFKSSVDSMRTSLLQLKNTFAAAFAPIVSVAIPYLEKLISYITKAINSVGQLIAALLGKKTYTKAIRVNVENLEDTSDALEEVKEEAKEAEKALDGYLSPLDEINKYSEDKEIKVDIDTPKKPDTSDIGDTMQDMFEEVPIDSYFLDLADKVKDTFSQLFAPLKEAWNREGKFVMDSWKYALKEVGDLLKSIGSDFLEVWQQEKTIKIFEDLLHIIGDIGLVVGNLAHNFRLAWEENETGKRILEGIRDIIGVIVANIRHAADATVEWSKNLDFSPLLTAIKNWIESLVPVFDNLSGIITDFYEKVLLPLGKWTIEEGLPELVDVLTAFNENVDWEALRERLAQFWEHLEPFAETVGEGLIIFISRLSDALAKFIGSDKFDAFLTKIEDWMDSVSPEDVADALENIAKAIIGLKGAVLLFKAGSAVHETLTSLISNLQALAAIGVIAATVYVGVRFTDDYKKWKESIEEYGWYEGRRKIAEANPANPYRNGTAITQEDGTGVFDQWMEKLKEWQANNREAREVEKREQGQWFDEMATRISDWWTNSVSPWFTAEKWSELWEGVKTAFSIKWGELAEWWNNSTLVTWWEESVSPWFTSEKWSELYENIKQALVDKWNEIVEWWSGTAIVGWWEEHVSPWFTAEKWMELFENIKTSLKEVWDNTVVQWVNDISAWWDEHVAPWFTKEKWEEILSSVPEAFSNGFAKVVDTVKGKIQDIIDWVVEKVDWLKEKVESVKETFNGFKSRVSGFFSGGSSESGVYSATPYSVLRSPAFASLSTTPIPRLATGAVIPANKEFLAVLGDQKRGTNIEAPLDTIKKALREEAISLGLTSSANSSQTVIAKLYLDGKQITEAVIKDGKVRQMCTGNNPFALGNI